MKINWQIVARVAAVAFLSVLSWIGGRLINKQDQILVKLNMLELELAKVQSSMLSESTVRMIVRDEIHNMGGMRQ